MPNPRLNDPTHFINTFISPDAMDFRDQLGESLRKLLALLTIGEGEHFLYHGEHHVQWYLATLVDLVKDALDAQEGLEALAETNQLKNGGVHHV